MAKWRICSMPAKRYKLGLSYAGGAGYQGDRQVPHYPGGSSGRPDPLLAAGNYRKLVLTNTYVAVHRVSGDTVYICRVISGTTDHLQIA